MDSTGTPQQRLELALPPASLQAFLSTAAANEEPVMSTPGGRAHGCVGRQSWLPCHLCCQMQRDNSCASTEVLGLGVAALCSLAISVMLTPCQEQTHTQPDQQNTLVKGQLLSAPETHESCS